MAAPTARVYFEDMHVGDTAVTPALTVTEAHVQMFQALAGEPSVPGVVPDILPLCLTTGLGWRAPRVPPLITAFVSIDWEMVAPLAVGDTMHTRSRITAKRRMRDAGVVMEEYEVVDQRGSAVQRGRFTFLVARRPKTDQERKT